VHERARGAARPRGGAARERPAPVRDLARLAWTQALDLDFPLLSDWNGDATHGFDVAHEYRGLRDVSRRSAFLIDGEGIIRGVWLYEALQLPDIDEILAGALAMT
jgi:peroxiredoxin